jgi:hypothetical protein
MRIISGIITRHFGQKWVLTHGYKLYAGKGFRTGSNLIKYSSATRKKCLPASTLFYRPEQMILLLGNVSGNDSFVNLKTKKKKYSVLFLILYTVLHSSGSNKT